MFATANTNKVEVIKILLASGANPNAKDKEGKRAIDYYRRNNELKCTEEYQELYEESK